MKTTIHINQFPLADKFPSLTLHDAALIDYISSYCKELEGSYDENSTFHFKLNYQDFMDELPMIAPYRPEQFKRSVSRLVAEGILDKSEFNDHYTTGSEWWGIFSGDI